MLKDKTYIGYIPRIVIGIKMLVFFYLLAERILNIIPEKKSLQRRFLGLAGTIAIFIMLSASAATALTFNQGDVFAAISSGRIQHYDNGGKLLETLDTGLGGYTTGMAFDASGNLYATDFSAQKVSKFSYTGALIGTFGSGYNANPESILFDRDGNAYVGQPDGTKNILKFNRNGILLASFAVSTGPRGADWIDLAADQCTMLYTSEGTTIRRFDVCNNKQLTDFASGLHGPSFALRILPDESVLVADSKDIHRLDKTGKIIQTYSVPGISYWFALNLDPDKKSFWSGDANTGKFFKFDIATGNVLMSVDTKAGSSSLWGLAVFEEPTASIKNKFKFIQLTDVHIGPDPECWSKYPNILSDDFNKCITDSYVSSFLNFIQVKDDIIKIQKPDFIIITGDLVEWNNKNLYHDLNGFLYEFNKNSINVYTVPGNHDRRGAEIPLTILNTVLPQNDLGNYNNLNTYLNQIVRSDKSQGVVDIQNEYKIIGLDSGYDATLSLSPKGSGLSKCYWWSIGCTDQLKFLNNDINDKSIIFMHHPAITEVTDANGNQHWNEYDVIKENREEFIRLMKDRKVKLVLTGHTHISKLYLNSYIDDYNILNILPNNCPNMYCEYDIDVSKYFNLKHPIHLDSPLFIQTRSATKGDDHGYLIINVKDNGDIQLEDKKMVGSEPVDTLTLHSPADLHVYDDFGRHTGLNATGNIENNIPNSYYFEEDKIGNITLPVFTLLYNTTLNYTYEIRSNFSKENVTSDKATFNFTIEQRMQSATTTVTYNDVLINKDSRAWVNTNQTDYAMQIDLNNDGTIDTTKMPDSIITDYAPTATIISPASGSTWDQGQPITFKGVGIDKEDGTLNNMTWISDRDDVIGHGNFTTLNLSAGVHNIFLRITDSKGQINTSSIIIFVNDTKPPILNIDYPPENKIFNKQNITVSGIALDDSGILNVTVNGIQAGKESWNATIALNEGENTIKVVGTDNSGLSTTANRKVYYNSSLASDTTPPATIKNLTHKTGYDSVNGAWINWTWDNPKDPDFSYTMVYLDGIPMGNTSRSYFNLTGLSSDADYNISILTADIVDNINYNAVVDTARTPLPDSIPPTTNLTLSGTLGNNGWFISDIQVNLTATDTDNEGGSGVNATEYSFDNATWNTYTDPFNITTEGTTTLYYYSTDNAGNIEPAKNQTISIDKTPPQVTINIPANGSSYILNQTILANWSANDSISGIASITSTAPSGEAIGTTTVGNKIFTVNATDNAGNQASKTATYNVVYSYSGILPPIKPDGSSNFKLGSTLPVKFQLWDANGNNVSTAIARFYLTNITNGATGKEINGTSTSNATTGNLFRYDSTSNQYIFNLATKPLSAGTWRIRIYIDDGTSKYATIGLK